MLIIVGTPKKHIPSQNSLVFNELRFDCSGLRQRQQFQARDGAQTLVYSHRLNTAYAPRDYTTDLTAITQPLLVVVGTAGAAFIAEQLEPSISKYTHPRVTLLQDVTRMGLVVSSKVQPVLGYWLESLSPPESFSENH